MLAFSYISQLHLEVKVYISEQFLKKTKLQADWHTHDGKLKLMG